MTGVLTAGRGGKKKVPAEKQVKKKGRGPVCKGVLDSFFFGGVEETTRMVVVSLLFLPFLGTAIPDQLTLRYRRERIMILGESGGLP